MASREALEQAVQNRAAIRSLMATYPGITQRECAAVLGLSLMCVNRHFNAVREGWRVGFVVSRVRRVMGWVQP